MDFDFAKIGDFDLGLVIDCVPCVALSFLGLFGSILLMLNLDERIRLVFLMVDGKNTSLLGKNDL